VLYGYLVLLRKPTVSSSELIRFLKSGFTHLDVRIDRAITPRRDYVTKSGLRRGAMYSLNAEGVKHAEVLIEEMLKKKGLGKKT